MTAAKPTAGPWRLAQDMRGVGNVAVHGVEDSNGHAVANCGTGGEGLANATRIAALPELLDACEKAIEWLEGWASAEPYIDVLLRAVANAKGTPP